MTTRASRLVTWLARAATPIYAVLDAARDDRVLASLQTTGADHESLYDGHQGAALADVAPYLVRVEPGSPLVDALAQGWGRAWGILLTSHAGPRAVRARLRRLTKVQVDGSPRALYFRFYDPRVLRALMPIATPRQVSWFFGDGEIGAYVLEDRDPSAALVFGEAAGGAVETRRVALDDERGADASAR